MKKEDLFRAVGDVGDDLIERADEPVRPARRKSYGWVKWTALAACAAVILYAAAMATFPEAAINDDYLAEIREKDSFTV